MITSEEIAGISFVFGATVLLLALHYMFRTKTVPKGLQLPPGPRGRLFIGNLFDMPSHHPWETYAQWAKEYGELVYIRAMRQDIVFVNSRDVARDLLDARSSIYSDRLPLPMLYGLMGVDWGTGFHPYDQFWRQQRRALHQHLHPKAAAAFHHIHVANTQTLVRNLFEIPEKFVEHFRFFAGAAIIKIIYGLDVLLSKDPHIKAAEASMAAIGKAAIPGTYLVDIIPILKYVPEWVPGAEFRRDARIWRKVIESSRDIPFQEVKDAINSGVSLPSVTASLLNTLALKQGRSGFTEEAVRNAAGTAYLAGADTTVATLSNFVLAMLLHQDVQQKAQFELDSVIGMDRLPTFEDRDNLPYVNAICKEILRWRPVLPLGIAHRVTQDDVYGNRFIPGGSIVIGNTWAILHDENNYGPEPEEFRPERFFRPGIKDPVATFGYGRRICIGRFIAGDALFIAAASILKMFDITPARDERGDPIRVEPRCTSGFVSFPEPFQCTIKPRGVVDNSALLRY